MCDCDVRQLDCILNPTNIPGECVWRAFIVGFSSQQINATRHALISWPESTRGSAYSVLRRLFQRNEYAIFIPICIWEVFTCVCLCVGQLHTDLNIELKWPNFELEVLVDDNK